MKTENDFNALLSKEFGKLERSGTVAYKVSDRFHVGISDFLLWKGSIGLSIESKFVKKLPKKTGLVLDRPFTGPQLTWLTRMGKTAECGAYGIVGLDETKMAYVFPYWEIPKSGNWSKPEFDEAILHARSFTFKNQDTLHVRLKSLIQDMIVSRFPPEFDALKNPFSEDDE